MAVSNRAPAVTDEPPVMHSPGRHSLSRAAWICALIAFAAAPVFALKSDRQQLLNVDADKLDAGLDDNRAVLEGNVRITQGTLVIEAATAVLTQGEGQETRRVLLTGSPVTLEQDLDEGGRLKARANQVDYDVSAESVVLTGAATVSQPRGEITGERIVYNTASGKLEATSVPGGRVHLKVQPKAAAPAPTP